MPGSFEHHLRLGRNYVMKPTVFVLLLSPAVLGIMGPHSLSQAPQAAPIRFNKDIRPILSAKCFQCHGPDAKRGGLDLQDRDVAIKALKSGATAIAPGQVAMSELVQRVTTLVADDRMPPQGEPLRTDEVAKLKAWIDQGAAYEEHWSYIKPKKADLPAVKDATWPRNPIDSFVLARLELEGLHPNPEADKAVLIRRVSLDLTGLPPTLAEVDQFLADTSSNSYEKLVDRLLASPAYGEHQARYWLDLARYADTNGYERDALRSIWPWRDWVTGAFNSDMPFDQFTIEQTAGDLLPDATLPQRIATGFHRNSLVNTEGGTQDDEFRVAAVVDRVNTTMTVWMGTTMACAQCHNHKYDPFSQKEYYQLYAFFNSTKDKGGSNAPEVAVPGTGLPKAPTTLVLQDLAKPRTTHVQIRGNYLNLGDEVQPDSPRKWHAFPEGEPRNRLGLARWLVHPDTPLAGRVLVNRLWARYFGTGFVETSEDFGARGDPPSHPELLDWLAVELVDQRWSLKAMHKLIVTSATYRQSAKVSPEVVRRDPYNRLLAHGPRLRLDAEVIRDSALAVSGLLNPKVGGPPVFPYQPEGIWANPYSNDKWVISTGGDQYRRGLYTFWRRTAPYPSFMTFDAPVRDVACERRARSNTPLQALTTLNDRAFVEPAAALARRMVKEAAGDELATAVHGFRLCLARYPTASEVDLLVKLYRDNLARYQKDGEAARTMAATGLKGLPSDVNAAEAAAWTVVANVLLNLDETLTK
jgi:hypothetical protein